MLYSTLDVIGHRISELQIGHCVQLKAKAKDSQGGERTAKAASGSRRPYLTPVPNSTSLPLATCEGRPGAAAASLLYTFAKLRFLHPEACDSAAQLLVAAPGHVPSGQAGLLMSALATLVGPPGTSLRSFRAGPAANTARGSHRDLALHMSAQKAAMLVVHALKRQRAHLGGASGLGLLPYEASMVLSGLAQLGLSTSQVPVRDIVFDLIPSRHALAQMQGALGAPSGSARSNDNLGGADKGASGAHDSGDRDQQHGSRDIVSDDDADRQDSGDKDVPMLSSNQALAALQALEMLKILSVGRSDDMAIDPERERWDIGWLEDIAGLQETGTSAQDQALSREESFGRKASQGGNGGPLRLMLHEDGFHSEVLFTLNLLAAKAHVGVDTGARLPGSYFTVDFLIQRGSSAPPEGHHHVAGSSSIPSLSVASASPLLYKGQGDSLGAGGGGSGIIVELQRNRDLLRHSSVAGKVEPREGGGDPGEVLDGVLEAKLLHLRALHHSMGGCRVVIVPENTWVMLQTQEAKIAYLASKLNLDRHER